MVGAVGQHHLIGAGEILQPLEILQNRADTRVENAGFDHVGVFPVARCHQQIAQRPRIIGHVAGLMALHVMVVDHKFVAAGTAVHQQVHLLHLFECVDDGEQIVAVAGMGIQNGAQLAKLVVGNAVRVDLLARAHGGYAVIVGTAAVVVGVGLFRQTEQSLVAVDAVGPQHNLHVHHIAVAGKVGFVVQVKVGDRLHDALVGGGTVPRHHRAEKHHVRPAFPATRPLEQVRPHIAVLVGVRHHVIERGGGAVDQRGIPQQLPAPFHAVQMVGGLLVHPPFGVFVHRRGADVVPIPADAVEREACMLQMPR